MNGIVGTRPMLAVGYGRITRGWMMPFNGMMQKGMMESGRGGACVPARVALQGRIHRSNPRVQCVYFLYGNAAACRPARVHSSFFFPWFGELLCEKSCALMRCTAFFMECVAPKGEPTRGL